MISGDRPVTPVDTIRASGVMPSSAALRVAHDDDRRGAVVERAAVAGGDRAVGAEHRLERGDRLQRHAGAGAVVVPTTGAVGQRDRGDLALPEAVGDGLLGQVLRADAELVLLLAGDALQPGRRSRRSGPSRCRRRGACRPRAGRARSAPPLGRFGGPRARPRRTAGSACPGRPSELPLREPATHLDAGGDEHVALAGLDRVERHPGGLQGRGAVAGDGGARAAWSKPSRTATTRAML